MLVSNGPWQVSIPPWKGASVLHGPPWKACCWRRQDTVYTYISHTQISTVVQELTVPAAHESRWWVAGALWVMGRHLGSEPKLLRAIHKELLYSGSTILCLIHYWTWWNWQPSWFYFLFLLGWLCFNFKDTFNLRTGWSNLQDSLALMASFPWPLADHPHANRHFTVFVVRFFPSLFALEYLMGSVVSVSVCQRTLLYFQGQWGRLERALD